MKLTKRQVINFWNKVNVLEDDKCWEWTASRRPQGYGQLNINRKLYYAHRISWQIANQKSVPKGIQVLHSCDNRKCVNPSHLWLGSQKDNIRDMVAKGRNNPWSPKGEAHPMARLCEGEVKAIRLLYATGKYTYNELSKKFDINQGHVGNIVNGKIWKHII